MSHMSRSMLRRYTRIRVAARREAVESLVGPTYRDEYLLGYPPFRSKLVTAK
jgi:hypothetical protein